MNAERQLASGGRDRGSALLIAIFALMLVSVVGLALVVSSGTDSALAGNYRNSTNGYYAAVAGLEEARGRLLWKNPDYINKTNAYSDLFSAQGIPSFGLTDVLYIINPVGGETVDPTDTSSPYADKEYFVEMGFALTSVHTPVTSVSPVPSASLPGPMYKWVRINPVTEKGLGLNVDSSSGSLNSFTPLNYNGNGLTSTSILSPGVVQALEITSFVLMPDKSTRLLQYVVVPNVIQSVGGVTIDFPAALTLAGNNVTFQGPAGAPFEVNGQDATPACSSPNYMIPAIGYTNTTDGSYANITAGATPASSYPGAPMTNPGPPPTASVAPQSIQNVSATMNANWLNPAWLETNVVENIKANADLVLNSNATGDDILAGVPSMSAVNPATVVVNGDLDLNAWHHTGYGLLVVTGTLYYDPDATWEGIVLVIGKGNFVSTKSGTGSIDGAMLVAQTRDFSGALLANLGASSFSQTGGVNSGSGVRYNSCWIHGSGTAPGAWGPLNYKVISFREFSQ
ncbi:MAG TPA: hypothetical protein VMJ35_03790 [Dongiaceae bacterium]|nr:hypothetical protein [Dongiaceae bacterium]